MWGVGGGLLATLPHGGPVTSGSFGPGGHVVLTTSRDGTARIWTPAGREKLVIRHGRPCFGGSISPDGRLLVTVSSDPSGEELRARVFALPSGRLVRELPAKGVTTASFDPSGMLLVTGGIDHTAAVWDGAPAAGSTSSPTSRAQSPTPSSVPRAGSSSRRARTARRGCGTPGPERGSHSCSGTRTRSASAAFSKDGRFLVTTSDDGTARVWEAETGRPESVLRGHGDTVTAGGFSPDGRTVATASADGTARVWDPGTANELRVFARARGPVWAAVRVRAGGWCWPPATTAAPGSTARAAGCCACSSIRDR